MATTTYNQPLSTTDSWKTLLRPLASLKLTVALFAASMVIVFAGTLAQDEQNMVEVKRQYFSSWLTIIPFDVFVPQPFKPHEKPYLSFNGTAIGIPFPGGALIGGLLLVNLIAAKLVRFQVTGKDTDLWIGIALTLVGAAMVIGVILFAHSADGLQGGPPMSYESLWKLLKAALFFSAIGLAWQGYRWRSHRVLSMGTQVVAGLLILTAIVLMASNWIPGEPNLRILWQLLQGGLAGVPLLIGFIYIFGRRGANALIHFGVGLLMIGQFAFGDRQLEQRLTMVEGEVTNMLRSLDQVELAVIDRSDAKVDRVIAIPESRLIEAESSKKPLHDERLPFDIEVLRYMGNSALGDRNKKTDSDTEPAVPDEGQGRVYFAAEREAAGGASSQMDLASTYVRFIDPKSKATLGTYLLSQYFSDFELISSRADQRDTYDTVAVNNKTFEVGLRFKRIPKPYWVKLDNVERKFYSGSATPRDYSSFVRMVDDSGQDREARIWMNNPLRFMGETFYQSDYSELMDGKERTGLQVVANEGWMIPYVCCMLVLMGLTVHFSDTLVRFAGRQERAANLPPMREMLTPSLIAVAVTGLLAVGMLYPRNKGPAGFDFYKAGKIPVSSGGRVMPLDSLASQTLVAASNKASVTLTDMEREELGELAPGARMSALQWCFEIATNDEFAEKLPIFRIDAPEVLNMLGIQPREKNPRYSVDELRKVSQKFNELVEKANDTPKTQITWEQQKLLELDQRVRAYTRFAAAFEPLEIPEIPSNFTDPASLSNEQMRDMAMLSAIAERIQSAVRMNVPSPIPPVDGRKTDEKGDRPDWRQLSAARLDFALSKTASGSGIEVSPALATFEQILDAYKAKDAEAFNRAVDEHLALVKGAHATDYQPQRVTAERWLQASSLANVTYYLYVLATVLALISIMAAGKVLRPITFGMLSVLLVLHTIAIVARIYVTGRPPVINLYSSAVFIGWSLVIAGLGLELLFRIGVGNLVAGISGAATLLIAHHLEKGDDTMGVLQAVLDTQFWLSTHVTTVALGYTATFLAGLLGILNLIVLAAKGATPATQMIHRMTYGVVCFGILFSFVGTVLGGLWADDSWGRFWGWDPKENGALLIVIWNALLLHARWDKLVGVRGFAMLAVAGNIVTAWSWFGTNQLNVGLHSYGFTNGVLQALIAFVISQLIVIGAGWMLTKPAEEENTVRAA